MNNSQCSFQQLPFSKLFNTYTSNFEALSEFFSVNPFNEEDITSRIERIQPFIDRSELVRALSDFHEYLGIKKQQEKQLQKLADPTSLIIVTGQQLGMYGGPLFTIYKTMTTILLAKKWEVKLGKPVIPVFWLADEDHDFEEIAAIGIPEFTGYTSVQLQTEGNGKPVSHQVIDSSIQMFNEELKSVLHETDFTNALWDQLNGAYTEGKSYVQAFAQLMSTWFSDKGVLFTGSNFDAIKKLSKSVFTQSIQKSKAIHQSLESKSSKLEEDFHRQVIVGESNLFYLDDEKGRQKIDKTNNGWNISGTEYSSEKLLNVVEEHPHRFSPNVFLRPILQDYLLPTIGYVAGPGELAYYAQMKELYRQFGMEMPVIFPRLSITLLESGISRIMEKLPFSLGNYSERIEDLEAQYIAKTSSNDIEGVFASWLEQLRNGSKEPVSFIKNIDPTLEATAGKTVTGFENELQKLKGRVIRSIKQQEETQLKRIAKIKSQLFPNGLQERSVSPILFMNKYGLDVWDQLLSEFEKNELDLRNHHVITL